MQLTCCPGEAGKNSVHLLAQRLTNSICRLLSSNQALSRGCKSWQQLALQAAFNTLCVLQPL